jgi:hypothetical protein
MSTHSIYRIRDNPGWDTVVYDSLPGTPGTPGTPGEHELAFWLSAESCTAEFELGGLVELERERRRLCRAYLPPPNPDDKWSGGFEAWGGPCLDPEAQVDRVDVTFAEGSASFHTRPARFGGLDGFTVLAEGTIDDIVFEVDHYWDLEYASSSAESLYGYYPMLAVRFEEQADGACILLLDWDHSAPPEEFPDKYLAYLFDCEQNELRELTVESMDWIPGGGEPRW